ARQRGLSNVLVFEDDVIFSRNALEELRPNIEELKHREWETLYLGGHCWGQTFPKAPGCQYLKAASGVTWTHAIAYHASMFDRVLAEVPETPSAVALWLRKHLGIDQYYAKIFDGSLITSPLIASQGSILAQETERFKAGSTF